MDWQYAVEKVKPYVVKIETPDGHGTGFFCLKNTEGTIGGIATAMHVVAHAVRWQQPIRIIVYDLDGKMNGVAFLKESERVVRPNWQNDSAMIIFPTSEIGFPEQLIPLFPTERFLPIGVEVGWLGFPAIEQYRCCFFSGNVSAHNIDLNWYLIDSVAINGVNRHRKTLPIH